MNTETKNEQRINFKNGSTIIVRRANKNPPPLKGLSTSQCQLFPPASICSCVYVRFPEGRKCIKCGHPE